MLPDAVFFSQRVRVVELATQGRLPGMYDVREFVAAGGLMSYGTRFPDLWRRVATYETHIGSVNACPYTSPVSSAYIVSAKP